MNEPETWVNEGGLTWAEMEEHEIRACAWCCGYHHLSNLEEVVLSEERPAKEPKAKKYQAGLAVEEGLRGRARRVVYRCQDEWECMGVRAARFQGDYWERNW